MRDFWVVREDQENGPAGGFAGLEQRVLNLQAAVRQIGHELSDALRIGRGRMRPIHRLLEARRGDQLHRPRNLADVADALASLIECPCFSHDLP